MSRIELYLLGTPIVNLDGQEVHFTLKRSLILLIYSILNRDRHDRVHLANLFWEENDNPTTALNHALSRLKRNLADVDKSFPFDDFFDSTHGSIEFKASHEDSEKFYCDTLELEHFTKDVIMTQASLSELEQVEQLYRGEFMGAYAINNVNAELEHWMTRMQAHFEACYVKLLQYLVKTYIKRGGFEAAVTHLQSLLKYEYLGTEANLGLLLIAYALLNQRYQIEIVRQQYQDAIAQLLPNSKTIITQLTRYLHEQPITQPNHLQFIQDLLQKLSPLQKSELGQLLQTIVLETTNTSNDLRVPDTLTILLKKATEEAQATGSKLVGTGHLFLALVASDKAQVTAVQRQLQIDLQEIATSVQYILQIQSSSNEQEMTEDNTIALVRILAKAESLARQDNDTLHKYHLWYALLNEESGLLSQIFGRYDLNQSQLLSALTKE